LIHVQLVLCALLSRCVHCVVWFIGCLFSDFQFSSDTCSLPYCPIRAHSNEGRSNSSQPHTVNRKRRKSYSVTCQHCLLQLLKSTWSSVSPKLGVRCRIIYRSLSSSQQFAMQTSSSSSANLCPFLNSNYSSMISCAIM